MGTAMMSAVGRPIPLRPMTILQPSVAFISFAVPGMAGRVTMEGAFLYKYGVPPTVSVTKGLVDSLSGFVVQVVILIGALLTGALILVPPSSGSSDGGTDSPTVSLWVIVVVIALAIATVVVVLKVPKIHDRVVPEVKKAWEALAEVLRSPKLALGLLGSQLAVQLLWGLALWLALAALGVQLSLDLLHRGRRGDGPVAGNHPRTRWNRCLGSGDECVPGAPGRLCRGRPGRNRDLACGDVLPARNRGVLHLEVPAEAWVSLRGPIVTPALGARARPLPKVSAPSEELTEVRLTLPRPSAGVQSDTVDQDVRRTS